jgi:hypothetical protein
MNERCQCDETDQRASDHLLAYRFPAIKLTRNRFRMGDFALLLANPFIADYFLPGTWQA